MTNPRRDELTGMACRLLVEEIAPAQFEDASARGWRVGVGLLDVDRFRLFNERFGHRQGDEVLRSLARLIVISCEPETLVARLRYNEFLLMLSEPTGIASLVQAEQLVREIPHEIASLDRSHRVTVTVGVAMFPCDAANFYEAVQEADRRLRAGKAAGGNRVVSHPTTPGPLS